MKLKYKNCGISIGIDRAMKYSRKSRKNSRYIQELSNVKKSGISHQYQKNIMMKQLYLKNNQGWILNLYTKMNYKFLRDLNIQEKTIEYLEIFVVVTSSYVGKDFLFIFDCMGLDCCMGFSYGEWRLLQLQCTGFSLLWLLLFAEHGLQSTQASVVAGHGLSSCSSEALEHRLSSCGAQVLFPRGMWDLPGQGIKPVSCTGRWILYH